MKISCCVFDLDGTLLTSENKISDADKDTLRRLSEDGIKIIIATGRAHTQILQYVHELGISDPSITCNGAQIINIIDNEVLYRSFIRKDDAINIIDVCENKKIDYLIYTADYVYHSEKSERIKFFKKFNETAPKHFRVPIKHVSEYKKSGSYSDIIKILIHDDISLIEELNKCFNSDNTLTIVSSGKNLIDIMVGNSSKANGIKIISEKLDIPIEEIVAFGDGMNDEEMLKNAGFSVAMGNAVDHIKSICDYTTKTNDEYGITHALNYILNEL